MSRIDKLTIQLDMIEEWLTKAPTQPHIEYTTSYNLRDDGSESIKAIRPRAIEVMDKQAMMSEWSHIREEVEKL